MRTLNLAALLVTIAVLGSPGLPVAGAATGCAISAANCQSNGQPSCSVRLRNRANCAGTVTDVPSCQAAGIVNFLKNSLAGWN